MNIIGLPALVGSYDNYIWILHDAENAWVVDPGESQQVIDYLERNQLNCLGILVTHYHFDHVEGIPALSEHFPNAIIYGPQQTPNPHIEQRLQEGDEITLFADYTLTVLDIPGHTYDHIAFYNQQHLFCGDLLFTGGCGRHFDGGYDNFAQSILKIRNLPDELGFFCGHEYTKGNLAFAKWVEPNNTDISKRMASFDVQYPQNHIGCQSTLGMEKKTNPFLRFDTPFIQQQLQARGVAKETATDLFKGLRDWKDEIDQKGYPQ